MDEKAIDLSPLDPSRDARRWDAIAASVVQRALQARQQGAARRASVSFTSSVQGQILSWARPALALAAGLALLVWGLALVRGSSDPARSGGAAQEVEYVDATRQLSVWAAGDASPSSSEILATFGGDHGS